MRKSALFLAAGAVLVLAAAAAARFVVLPMVHQVPANLDVTTKYAGTISMINPLAMASGDASKLFVKDVPVTVEQRVRAASVSGRTVVMSSDTLVKGPDGGNLVTSNHVYSLDRITLEAVSPPPGSNAEPAAGLALGFPLEPKQQNYQYWDSNTQTANPASYDRTEEKGGRTAYVFKTRAIGPVKDPKLSGMLPAALPKSALPLIAANLPDFVKQALNFALPLLPESIPLSYTSTSDTTFWVDSATGVVLDVNQRQTITASVAGPLSAVPIPAAFDLSIKSTEESIKAGAEQARTAETGLKLVGIYAPIGLGAFGGLLLIAAFIAAVVRRKPKPELALTEQQPEQQPEP